MSISKLQELGTEILEFLWADNPVHATGLGIHKYDSLYPDYSESYRQSQLKKKKAFLSQLEGFDDKNIGPQDAIDREILLAHLKTGIYKDDVQSQYAKNPSIYPSEALMGVQQLQINYNLPIDERVQAIIGRLNAMPTLFEQGIENLKKHQSEINTISINVALDALKNGKQFLEEIVPQFSATVPLYFKDLLDSNTKALKSMHHFGDFLDQLLPQASSSFACGKEYFEFLLKDQSFMDYSIEEVIALSESVIQETEKHLNEVAKELDPDLELKDLVKKLQKSYPEKDGLLHFYKGQAERIRDFMVEEKLFTLPEEETLVIMETPIFQRNLFPYSGYVTPAAFEAHQTGYFWITPVSDTMSEEEITRRMEGHNIYNVILTNVHHAYPGQHLLFVRANQHPSTIRKSVPDYCLAQGWPFYCEEMLYTEGLYPDLKTRLFQLKDQLWRAYRALTDAKMHSGEMSYDEAKSILVEKAGLDPASADAEIKRYSLFPTSGVGYLLGKNEIIKMRQEVSDIEGDDFSLIQFHDNLLSFGMIPLALLRREILSKYQGQA